MSKAPDYLPQEDIASQDCGEEDEPGDLDLEYLLYREIGILPLLEKTEERQLTQHARAAWQRLLACLREHQGLCPGEWTDDKVLDSVSERDVVRLIEQLQTCLKQAQGDVRGTSWATARLEDFLSLLQHHLADFRQSRDELIRRNLRLIASIARRYRGRSIGYLDLIQEGTFGLMRAIEKFDPDRDVRFSTYAIVWIWQAMAWAQNHYGGAVVHLPASAQARRRRLARRSYRALPDQPPVAAGSAEELPDIQVVSLDTPLGKDDKRRLEEILSHLILPSPEATVVQSDHERQLHNALAHLPPRQADILRLRYGLDGRPPLTLEKIGVQFDVSPERVRQIEGQARTRLRHICQQDADSMPVATIKTKETKLLSYDRI